MAHLVRVAGGEIRCAEDGGRPVVEGVALPYAPATGRQPDGPISIPKGGVKFADFVIANLQHDRTRALGRLGRNLEFSESADGLSLDFRLELLTDTSSGQDAWQLVQAGVYTGASVEISVQRQRHAGGVRLLERVLLTGLALVDQPAFESAVFAEAQPDAPYQPARRRLM